MSNLKSKCCGVKIIRKAKPCNCKNEDNSTDCFVPHHGFYRICSKCHLTCEVEEKEKCGECQFEESHSQECSKYKPSLTYKAQTDDWQFEYGTVNKEGISFSSNYSVVIGNNQTGKLNYLTIGFGDDIIVDKEITTEQFNKFSEFFTSLDKGIRADERRRVIEGIKKVVEKLPEAEDNSDTHESVISRDELLEKLK